MSVRQGQELGNAEELWDSNRDVLELIINGEIDYTEPHWESLSAVFKDFLQKV